MPVKFLNSKLTNGLTEGQPTLRWWGPVWPGGKSKRYRLYDGDKETPLFVDHDGYEHDERKYSVYGAGWHRSGCALCLHSHIKTLNEAKLDAEQRYLAYKQEVVR